MKQIWKYVISQPDAASTKGQLIDLPKNAEFLHSELQYNMITTWWVIDPDAAEAGELQQHRFHLYGTGIPFDRRDQEYLATFQLYGGSLVVHLFDQREE